MKALKRLLATLLSLVIATLIATWSSLAIIGSATTINQLIVASGGYETAATQTRTAMLSSANIPEQYRAVITQAFEKSITAQQMETIVQPLLVDIVGWLDQPTGTPAPQLVVNLSPLKQQLTTELSQSEVSEIEKTALVAQVGKQIPDQLDLAQAQGLAAQQGVTPSGAAPTSEVSAGLTTFKAAYSALRLVAGIGLVVLAGLLAAVLFLGRKDGRAMLRRPAWAFISAGLLATIIWMLARVMQVDQAQQQLVIALSVAREVSGVIVWYSLASVVFGAALYGLSFLLKQPVAAASTASPIAVPPTTPIQPPVTTTGPVGAQTEASPKDVSR